MQDYILHIHVIEATKIPKQTKPSYYVRLGAPKSSYKETKVLSSNQPQWNSEEFCFQFPSQENSNLKVTLFNGYKDGHDVEIGNFTISLADFQINKEYDEQFELKAQNKLSTGYLRLKIKLTEKIITIDDLINMLDDDIVVEIPTFGPKDIKSDEQESATLETSSLTAKIAELEKQLANKDKEYSEKLAIEMAPLKLKIEQLTKQLESQDKKFQTTLENQISDLKKQHEIEISRIKKEGKKSLQVNHKIEILDSETIDNYEKLEEISFGSSGKVYKVAKKNFYALKVMKLEITPEEFKHFLNEYELLCLLEHPNIVKTFGIFLSDKTHPPSILLEFCPMNLESAIKKGILSNVEIVFSIYQIVEGMKYFHFKKVIHRDLKPSNILFDNDGTIKISDFGISKLMNAEEQSMTGGVGTQKFMAPEIIDESEDYNEKVDVYSFGVLLFFMLTGGELPKIKMSDKMKGKKAEIPKSFTELSKQLISACWNFNANDRPSFDQIFINIEKNDYKLLELTSSEIEEVNHKIKDHQQKIPDYLL